MFSWTVVKIKKPNIYIIQYNILDKIIYIIIYKYIINIHRHIFDSIIQYF